MINRDDPRHEQQRKLVSGRFSPRAVRRHEERVRAIVAELIAAAAEKGTVDVVRDLAAPLPAMVIAELLGFDRAHWRKCMEWSERTMSSAGFRNDDPRQPAGSPEAIDGIRRRIFRADRGPPPLTRAMTWCPSGCTAR